jgi:hypothetical protein
MTTEEINRLKILLSELQDCESSLYHGNTERASYRIRDAMYALQRIIDLTEQTRTKD